MALSKITNLSITDDAVRTVGIQDDNVTLAKLGDGTQGDILYYGASGAPARLGFGTSGDFLKTQGTGANPAWATVTDSGIVLKREVTGVTAETTVTSTSTTSYTDTSLTANITTSEADSTVTCEFSQFFAMQNSSTSGGISIGFVKLLVDYDGAGYTQASGNLWGAYMYEGLTIVGRLRGPGSLCGAFTTPTQDSGTVVSFKTQFYVYNTNGASAIIYAQSDSIRSTMILTELSTT